ncbi:MAG TPA: hypothetical protein VNY24_07135 [Candidatus Acidoferrales bacterium]|nr:hypothetical protein [Candidatus Acidoferrales bacterium]
MVDHHPYKVAQSWSSYHGETTSVELKEVVAIAGKYLSEIIRVKQGRIRHRISFGRFLSAQSEDAFTICEPNRAIFTLCEIAQVAYLTWKS